MSKPMTDPWVPVCAAAEIAINDAFNFEHQDCYFAIFRLQDGRYYATDGLCTHEAVELADGYVDGEFVECPMHQARFHIPTGAARSAPACVNLRTWPVKIVAATVFIDLSDWVQPNSL